MTVQKVSLSFDPALAERARQAAEARGQSLSAFVVGAVEYRLKLEEARRHLQAWARTGAGTTGTTSRSEASLKKAQKARSFRSAAIMAPVSRVSPATSTSPREARPR